MTYVFGLIIMWFSVFAAMITQVTVHLLGRLVSPCWQKQLIDEKFNTGL
jgi:hypothetical protein